MEEREALVKLAAGRLSLHSPTHSVLARIEAAGLRDSDRNDAHKVPKIALKIDPSETNAGLERDKSGNREAATKQCGT